MGGREENLLTSYLCCNAPKWNAVFCNFTTIRFVLCAALYVPILNVAAVERGYKCDV